MPRSMDEKQSCNENNGYNLVADEGMAVKTSSF